ncbi:hypothetical protein BGZ80_004951 [Entomortierella chlamydospora]|uniref:Uncharacterized protein n=2 Tax=Entomortierella chlamydospora TaxID=101097 RepID=A0A9P6MM13_9FUNG|nr:hypothetical protein BGZ79_003572 [Entomortierella chlamydospora]KAG0007201.1 hypothetical protein BGZ80_004951 [Entomortierella chlamydospora]
MKKFDITDKATANESYSSLIKSPCINKTQQKLQNAYELFLKRFEKKIWERRAVIAQNASVKELSSGFERYRLDSKTIEYSDYKIIDDRDTESETDNRSDAGTKIIFAGPSVSDDSLAANAVPLANDSGSVIVLTINCRLVISEMNKKIMTLDRDLEVALDQWAASFKGNIKEAELIASQQK